MESRKIRWVGGYVPSMGLMRNGPKISRNLLERDHLQDLSMDGKVILEWILGK
jgi:hypothetical protein